jgi:diguanylate cyclase (GGDEF)-like protein/PAS domain S-box-containing protein
MFKTNMNNENTENNHQKFGRKLLAEIIVKIRQSSQLIDILQTAVTEVKNFLQVDRVFIYQFNEADDRGEIIAESFTEKQYSIVNNEDKKNYNSILHQEYKKIADHRQITVFTSLNQHQELSESFRELLKILKIQGKLIVPIIIKEQTWGLLIADHCQNQRKWERWQIELMEQLGNELAIAVDHAQMLLELQQAQIHLEKEVEKRTLELEQLNKQLLAEIQHRNHIEKILMESEERYALVLQGTNDGIWDWQLLTNKIYFSPRWKLLLGYEETEIENNIEQWFNRVHPEDLPRLITEIQTYLEGITPELEIEHRILHKQKGYRWVLTRGITIKNTQDLPYRLIGSLKDITKRKLVEEQLRQAAFYDPLTSLPNRVLFMDRLGHTLALKKRWPNYQFAILFLDLDRFKILNDSLGHQVGDELLVWIAGKIKSCLLPGDTLARIGGDEFAILLENIKDINDATEVANKIQEELQKPFDIDGHEVFITTSIGISIATEKDSISDSYFQQPENFLRDADIAMYRAKSAGKARYEIFNPEMHSQAVALLKLETDLRKAIEKEELHLYYQPIIDLKTSKLLGFEALLRWKHSQKGLISPADFIPIAEETGLIIPIGLWVLEQSCKQLKYWGEKFPKNHHLSVSVNLSVKQLLSRENLLESISNNLIKYKLNKNKLKLEITETFLMENSESATELLRELKALGLDLNMDDFGTGYSSLSYLHRFPIDTLKIDRSFISSMGTNGEDTAIVSTIISLAHNLGMTVTAEGIETKEQLHRLQKMGCDYGQGYYFSPPVNAEIATELITKDNEYSNNWQLNLFCEINDNLTTKNKKLADLLANDEKLYSYIIQTLAEGIWILDPHNKTVFINQKMARILGYKPTEMSGKHLFDFIPEQNEEITAINFERRILGIGEDDDFKLQCKNGLEISVIINSHPIIDQQGEYIGVLIMITDITARKKAELALKQQTEKEKIITEIAQKIRQSLDWENILNTTVAEVREFLQTDRVILYKFKPDWTGFVIVESVQNSDLSVLGMEINDECFNEKYVGLYQQGKIKAIPDIYHENLAPCHRDFLARFKVNANLVVPILHQDKLWGLLIAHECYKPRNWQQLEIELLQQLATQVAIAIQQSELYRELELANQELKALVINDRVTKLADSHYFEEYLQTKWQIARENNHCLSLILCDIDNVKLDKIYESVNTDRCLQQIALNIQQILSDSGDLLARYEGDKLAIILPNKSAEEVLAIAETIITQIQSLPIQQNGCKINNYFTVSLGISTVIPSSEMSSSLLIEQGKKALEKAKNQGGNCLAIAHTARGNS